MKRFTLFLISLSILKASIGYAQTKPTPKISIRMESVVPKSGSSRSPIVLTLAISTIDRYGKQGEEVKFGSTYVTSANKFTFKMNATGSVEGEENVRTLEFNVAPAPEIAASVTSKIKSEKRKAEGSGNFDAVQALRNILGTSGTDPAQLVLDYIEKSIKN
jgi:hypothetical protein